MLLGPLGERQEGATGEGHAHAREAVLAARRGPLDEPTGPQAPERLVLAAPDRYAGRAFEIAGDTVTGDDLARLLSHAAGRKIGYERLPDEVLAGDPLPGRLAALLDDGRLADDADVGSLRTEFPYLLGFKNWLAGPGAPLLHEALRTTGTAALR